MKRLASFATGALVALIGMLLAGTALAQSEKEVRCNAAETAYREALVKLVSDKLSSCV